MSGNECVNCGSKYSVTVVREDGKRRLWCSLCGYWGDRHKARPL